MGNSTAASNLNLRAYKRDVLLTNNPGFSSAGRIVDTKNAISYCYALELSAAIPIMGTFDLVCTYSLKQSDVFGGPFIEVPASQLIIKPGQEDLNLSYGGGGTPPQILHRRIEVGAFDTLRYLKMDIEFSGSVAGGAAGTSTHIYRGFITSEAVQPN